MKIDSVDIMQVPGGNRTGSFGDWNPVIIRINTDEGISGFGEAGLAFGKGWRAGMGMLEDFSEIIIGEDPLQVEKIWEMLFRRTFWGLGGGTVVYAAASAINIALWDIMGKAAGLPVWQLLGGKTNDGLRSYASQVQYGWGADIAKKRLIKPEEYAEVTLRVMEEGYGAIKVDPVLFSDRADGLGDWKIRGPLESKVIRTVYDRVAAMRRAGGDDLDIIVENHANTDTVSAIQIGRALEELRIFYYEEPCHPLNVQNMTEVRNRVNIPIASGERIYTRFGYRPFFEAGALQVIQPDVCLCGGLSEAKKICDMGHAYDCTVQIHVCGSPIATAAALQLEAVLPNFLIHEHHQRALGREMRDMCLYDYQPSGGRFAVPDKPGIGQELTPETIRKCNVVSVKRSGKYM